jgi:hypothetical protein
MPFGFLRVYLVSAGSSTLFVRSSARPLKYSLSLATAISASASRLPHFRYRCTFPQETTRVALCPMMLIRAEGTLRTASSGSARMIRKELLPLNSQTILFGSFSSKRPSAFLHAYLVRRHRPFAFLHASARHLKCTSSLATAAATSASRPPHLLHGYLFSALPSLPRKVFLSDARICDTKSRFTSSLHKRLSPSPTRCRPPESPGLIRAKWVSSKGLRLHFWPSF